MSAETGGHGPNGTLQARPAPGTNGTHPVPPLRVLVVDDDTAQRLVLGRGLARRGYEVFLAGSGADALAQLARDPGIGAVVSDVAMPTMSGVELATQILRQHAGVPVLFVTGGEAPVALLEHPLIGLISKPVRVTDVCDRLDQLVDQAAVLAQQGRVSGLAPPAPPRSPDMRTLPW